MQFQQQRVWQLRWLLVAMVLVINAGCMRNDAVEDELYFDSDGVRIHYRVYGNGPDVVLIHGLTSNAEDNWHTVVAALSAEYRLITLDVRGHGKSGGPHEPNAYGKKMVEDVVHLMDHLSIERAHVVGYSMGASIGLHLAIDKPQRVRSLVVGGQGWASAAELAVTAAAAQPLRDSGSALVLIPDPQAIRSDVRDRFMKTLAQNDPLALASLLDDYPQLAVDADKLRETTVPILLVSGMEDPYLPRVDMLKSIRPDAEVVLIPGETHLSTPSSPKFVAAIEEFLQANP